MEVKLKEITTSTCFIHPILLMRELGLGQPGIRPAGRQPRRMRPLLHDLTGLQHPDEVDVADGGEG